MDSLISPKAKNIALTKNTPIVLTHVHSFFQRSQGNENDDKNRDLSQELAKPFKPHLKTLVQRFN